MDSVASRDTNKYDAPHGDHDPVVSLDWLFAGASAHFRVLFDEIIECDRLEVWAADGCRDMAHWLSGRLGISAWNARKWVDSAYAIQHLPLTSAAFVSGALSVDKVVELTRFATPETEAKLIRWAQRVLPSAVRHKADVAMRSSLEEIQQVHRSRFLQTWWYDDGKALGFMGALPADEGAKFKAAIDRIVDTIPDSPEDDPLDTGFEDLSIEQKRADALVAMASATLADDQDTDRATVIVHAELSTLLDGGSAEAENGGVLAAPVIDRLLCDARIQGVVKKGDGHPIGIGHVSRSIPPWLMRQLRYRDRCCTFPGCGATRFVQGHHIDRWPLGRTELDNLTLVCTFHHKLVHEYRWKVLLNSKGVAEWFRPSGKRYEPGVDPGQGMADRAPPALAV